MQKYYSVPAEIFESNFPDDYKEMLEQGDVVCFETERHLVPFRQLLSDEQRLNMLTGALEGGSNYWYWFKNAANRVIESVKPFTDGSEPFVERLWEAIKAGKQIEVHDIDNRELLGTISLQSIERGEQTMAEKHAEHFGNIISENDDAETADVWFQLAVMNELTYG
jgi:hypothetical protein